MGMWGKWELKMELGKMGVGKWEWEKWEIEKKTQN